MPLVSVIIPAYNAEKHLRSCVESVIRQSWKNIEIIIVDDGSSDQTPEIALNFESERVKVILQENKGGCAARNQGIKMSSGKYLQFLDADDMISPDKIKNQVLALEQYNLNVAVCPTVHFMDGQNPYLLPVPEESFYLHDTHDTAGFFARLWGAYGKMHMVQTSAWLIPRALVEQAGMWNEKILLDQDGEFYARIVLSSTGIKVTNGINYYRKYIHGNNVASKYKNSDALSSAIKSSELKTNYLLEASNNPLSRKAVANVFMQLAVDSYPLYPELYYHLLANVKALKEKPVIPILGGRIIELVKQIFGWKTAKRLSLEYHKILHQLIPVK